MGGSHCPRTPRRGPVSTASTGEASTDDFVDHSSLDLGLHASAPDGSRAHRLRKAGIEALRAVRGYATALRRRRRVLLRYFGDETPMCGGCDLCDARGIGADSPW